MLTSPSFLSFRSHRVSTVCSVMTCIQCLAAGSTAVFTWTDQSLQPWRRSSCAVLPSRLERKSPAINVDNRCAILAANVAPYMYLHCCWQITPCAAGWQALPLRKSRDRRWWTVLIVPARSPVLGVLVKLEQCLHHVNYVHVITIKPECRLFKVSFACLPACRRVAFTCCFIVNINFPTARSIFLR